MEPTVVHLAGGGHTHVGTPTSTVTRRMPVRGKLPPWAGPTRKWADGTTMRIRPNGGRRKKFTLGPSICCPV